MRSWYWWFKETPISGDYTVLMVDDQVIIRRRSPGARFCSTVVQTVVDEIYGGLWAPPRFRSMKRAGISLGSPYSTKDHRDGVTGGEWLSDLWVLCEIGDVALASVCSRKVKLK